MINKLSIRVYGILLNNKNQLLVSDEIIKNEPITKLTGGGVELGEGIIDALIREFKEELEMDIEIIKHVYTTDFMVVSRFMPNTQVIAIYYLVACKSNTIINCLSTQIFDKELISDYGQSVRWINIDESLPEKFSFLTEKKAAQVFLSNFR